MSTRQPVPAVLLAIAVIAAGAAAPVTAGIAGAADDGEPNDDFETATPITEGNVSAETVAGESDFYRIEANTTDAVDIVVTPESGPVVVTLYDGDRERLARERNRLRRTNPVETIRKLPETGTYFIEVRGKDTRTGPTTTNYTLDYDRITPPENDAFAPNDGFESAATITQQFSDAKTWGGESDFYRVGLNASEALAVEVTPESGPVVVTLYGPDRERLARDRNRLRRTGTVRITRRAPETGSYYVEVRGKDTRTGPTTTAYKLESNRTGTLPVWTPPPVVGDRAPRDPDADGVFEDVNGDGDVTPGDATVLFNAVFEENAAVTGNVAQFDFNGDGGVTPGDATVLFDEIFTG